MNWIADNKGNVLVTVLAVVLGLCLGLLVHSYFNEAEAVLGGQGNLSDTDNPHNLSYGSAGVAATSTTDTRICIFCHTPHQAITDASLLNAPLWNHTLSSQTYTLKPTGLNDLGGSPGIVNKLTTSIPPDGASRLCLSCHDGSVSVGLIASGPEISVADPTNSCVDANGKIQNTSGCAFIGTDLTDKHSVSVPMNDKLITAHIANCQAGVQSTYLDYPWDTGNGDTVLLRPTTATYGGDLGIGRSTGKYKSGYSYGVQCSTCHDPHYWTTSTDDTQEGFKFLVKPFNSLCTACHSGPPCP